MRCMSRKSKTGPGRYVQCPHKCQNASEYCGRHSKAKIVWRIDRAIPQTKKQSLLIVKKTLHGWIIRDRIKKLFGPAWKDPCLIDDEMDCVTFDNFWTLDQRSNIKIRSNDIHPNEILSYEDPWNNRICGFRLSTINKLSSIEPSLHPITRLPLPKNITDICERRIQFMKDHNMWSEDKLTKEPIPESATDFIDLITSALSNINITISNEELNNLSDDNIRNL